MSDNVEIHLPEENRTYTIDGRVAEMVRYLLLNYEKVTKPATIKLRFDCIGGKISGVEITETERL